MNLNKNDKIQFFYSFIQSPKRIGSIIPSSSYLAREMFRSINFAETKTIIELGAGTGVFTKIIAKQLSHHANGIIFEQNTAMRIKLMETFPELQFHSNALEMENIVQSLGEPGVDVVISSLPFANFSQEIREQIAHDIYNVLKPNGKLVAFQYSKQMKQMFETLFDEVTTTFVPINIPPAFVFNCNKFAQ